MATWEDDTLAIAFDPFAFLAGVSLEDPLHDRFPMSATDPGVVDVDDDGWPGFSIDLPLGRHIEGGLRLRYSITGMVDASGAISGSASVSYDFAAYGDNIPFFDASARSRRFLEDYKFERVVSSVSGVPSLSSEVVATRLLDPTAMPTEETFRRCGLSTPAP